MRLFRRLAAFLLLAAAACTVNIPSSPTAFNVREGAKLRGEQRIALHNAYETSTVVTILRHGQNRWQTDLKSSTDTAISMLGRHMSKEGILIDSAAAKRITLRVHEVTAIAAFFANRASLTLEANLGNGAVRSVRIHNTAPDAQRVVDGAIALGLAELLRDEQFVAYVNAP